MKFYHLLKLLFLIPLLSSCGQIGPLYLPVEEPPVNTNTEIVKPVVADEVKKPVSAPKSSKTNVTTPNTSK